ncbi:MAG: hypothetical protein Q8N60_04995 [Candidatus Diapherotrites archaeon]|nr:hypothetical protein [Candidatus Diapherotrites archaeon]
MFAEKNNKKANTGFETTLLKNPKASNSQNNGFLAEINEFKNQQENIYSRTNSLEEATIQLQNELSEIKRSKNIEPTFSKNREKLPKSNRIKILEEYLKKT